MCFCFGVNFVEGRSKRYVQKSFVGEKKDFLGAKGVFVGVKEDFQVLSEYL